MEFNQQNWREALEENDRHMNSVIPNLLKFIEEHLAPAVAERNYLKIAALLSTLSTSARVAAEEYVVVAQAIALTGDGTDE